MTHEPAPLIFLDTETTGLRLDDEIWEFAAIRREPDGTETTLHLFIEHDEHRCFELPEPFRADHLARFPGHRQATPRCDAAHRILRFIDGYGPRPHIVGAVPNFDTERVGRFLRAQIGDHIEDPWHYHLIDVENLAVGAIATTPMRWIASTMPLAEAGFATAIQVVDTAVEMQHRHISPPWDSDALSHALGIDPAATGPRHTALADARCAMAIYDRVMGAPLRLEARR